MEKRKSSERNHVLALLVVEFGALCNEGPANGKRSGRGSESRYRTGSDSDRPGYAVDCLGVRHVEAKQSGRLRTQGSVSTARSSVTACWLFDRIRSQRSQKPELLVASKMFDTTLSLCVSSNR